MNISPVSSNSGPTASPFCDNIIKQLEKQKQNILEQIQKTSESKLDAKAKQDKIEELRQQIQDIDAQIQQRQRERFTPKQDQNRGADKQSDSGGSSNPAGMSDLIQAGAAYTTVKAIHGIKKELTGRGTVLKGEIATIEKGGGKAVYQRNELQKVEAKTKALDKKIGEAGKKLQTHVEEASKEEKTEGSKAEADESPRGIDIKV